MNPFRKKRAVLSALKEIKENNRTIICPRCGSEYKEDILAKEMYVCPDCGHHFKVTSIYRIKTVLDEGSFREICQTVKSADPLGFPGYTEKLSSVRKDTGLREAVITGTGRIDAVSYTHLICIIPRVYTNKPRTTGMGYKGMLHQPDPSRNEDMLRGIVTIRETYIRAMKETGFFCADEMLYPENYRYLSDLLSYVAVGARSVENQFHRLTASGLDIPVGMKNPTSGDLSVMINAITAAQGSHTFIYRNWEVVSKGNPYAHAVSYTHLDVYKRQTQESLKKL